MNIVAIIQARMGSTRMPNKVMHKIIDTPMIKILFDRVSLSKKINKIILATTTNHNDDLLANYLKHINYDVYRGDEVNVLDRYYQAAEKENADVIVRITGDCPLVDSSLVDQCVQEFKNSNVDYFSNIEPPTFPDGLDIEVMSLASLKIANKEASTKYDREHVTPYIHKNPEKFQISNFENDIDLSNFRWAVDEKDDLLFVKKIVSKLNKKPILINDILNVIKNEPKIFEINLNVNRNAGDKKSTKEDIEFLKNREKQNE